MESYDGLAVLAVGGELHDVYADAFSGPPWNKRQAGIDQFRERLESSASQVEQHPGVTEDVRLHSVQP